MGEQPGEGEGEQEVDQGEHRHRGHRPQGQRGHPEPPEHQDPDLVKQVHPKDALPQSVHRPAAGALLAHPQHIAEQGAQGGRRQGHPRGGVAVPQLPASADEAGPRQGEDHPQDAQDVDEKLRNAADGEVPQIPPGQVVAHIAQHHVDLEPLQQDGEHPVGVEGGPQGQHAGKEEGQAQDVQNLPPAGRRGEPLEQGVDQIQADEGI